MVDEGKLPARPAQNTQFNRAQQFRSAGAYAFAIHRVGAGKLFFPLHLPAPAVFAETAECKTCLSAIGQRQAHFLKETVALLYRYIGKAIAVAVEGPAHGKTVEAAEHPEVSDAVTCSQVEAVFGIAAEAVIGRPTGP
jgi:hypothetical protein